MHSQEYNYLSNDIRYADDKDDIGTVTFNYNSDLSGEIIIVKRNDRYAQGYQEMRIPGWMLLEFAGRYLNGELIEEIEGWSGRETLIALRRMLA